MKRGAPCGAKRPACRTSPPSTRRSPPRCRWRQRKGLEDLAALLARPEQEIHCLELIGGGDTGDAGPALDARARSEYQAPIRELQGEIDAAQAANDLGRAERSVDWELASE